MPYSIAILGKNGAMGQATQRVIEKDPELALSDKIDIADFVIDFSSPSFLLEQLPKICEAKVPLVSGTTGFTDDELDILDEASQKIPIFYSENFSLGITFLQKIVCDAAYLPSLLSTKIYEVHHTRKKDQPSGTALKFHKKLVKCGLSPAISSDRKGEEVGMHKITFDLLGERLELTHQAFSKETYAKGAVEAGKFLLRQPLGFYSMDDYYSSLEA